MRKTIIVGSLLALTGCAGVMAKVVAFEQRAAPVVTQACGYFRQAEANPLVQIALAGGATAATMASGIPVGVIIADIKSYGDAFCTYGPPAGDATTPEQQARWLAGLINQMAGVVR